MPQRKWTWLALPWLGLLLIGGCAKYPKTPHLDTYDLEAGYRFENLKRGKAPAPGANVPTASTNAPTAAAPPPTNSDELFVVLAFSGGGTRAAALSYGVLRQLEAVKFHWDDATHEPVACAPSDPRPACQAPPRSLLDEVDVISSVSGGSHRGLLRVEWQEDLR